MSVRLTTEDPSDIETIIVATSKLERKTEATATETKEPVKTMETTGKKAGKGKAPVETKTETFY